jgi:tRNA (adenine37-N6)-methyltransferase
VRPARSPVAWQHELMSQQLPLRAIGVVRTRHQDRETTPIQAALSRAELGTIEISEAYRDGLDGLAGFDYAWLLTWLHEGDQSAGDPAPMRQVPFLLRRQHREIGIFATRGPRRVNPIGLSLIRIIEVTGTEIRFAGVDVVSGTPVIDVKPYVARFDMPPGQPRCGWFDDVAISDGLTPAELGQNDPPH